MKERCSIESPKKRILWPYEEVAGKFKGLSFSEGELIAQIGRISIFLPPNIESLIRPLIGQEIAILRTDLPQKEYIFHILTEEENDGEGG
jgi:hypothetical protein